MGKCVMKVMFPASSPRKYTSFMIVKIKRNDACSLDYVLSLHGISGLKANTD